MILPEDESPTERIHAIVDEMHRAIIIVVGLFLGGILAFVLVMRPAPVVISENPDGSTSQVPGGAEPAVMERVTDSEFHALARRLRASDNPYVGIGRLAAMRVQGRTMAGEPLNRRLENHIGLALELLKHGQADQAIESINTAFSLVKEIGDTPETFPFLYRARALAFLRKAEIENCIANHHADCCIFPLRGRSVHVLKAPAAQAMEDYVAYLRHFPNDLGVRWLLNLAAMAAGQHPHGVPDEFVIVPEVFESTESIPRFIDVAPNLGIDTFNLCGGAIVDDLNGDSRLDILTSTFDIEGPMTTYFNAGDGTFVDGSEASGVTEQLGGLNCIGADYDNDGDLDVLVLRGAWLFDDGRIRNSLLRNDGNGKFTDITRDAGLAEPAVPTQAAAWADFDNDGWIDLYIGNESRIDDPSGQYPSQLFRNNRDGTFTDVAMSAGVTNDRFCKGVAAGDSDNDGDIDLYVSNFGPNRLYRNNGDGTFTDIAPSVGLTEPMRSFATWFFDYNNDGWLDLFVTAYEAPIAAVAADHLGQSYNARHPAMYRNNGDGTFVDTTRELGLDHAWLPMGAGFGDLDNDGYLDIYLATGDPDYESLMPNVMLRNDAGRRFLNVTTAGGFGHLQKGHGVVFADIDDDGDQDIYNQLGGFYPGDGFHNALFRNPGGGGRFLYLSLRGARSPRSGWGARIEVAVTGPGGARSIHRAVGSVSSFGGSPRRLEIGLGDAVQVDRVVVRWPISGHELLVTGVALDSWIEVTEGEVGYRLRKLQPVELRR